MTTEIARILSHVLQRLFPGKSQAPNWENLLTNYYRSLDAKLHYDLQCPAAKDASITHAAAASSNLDAAVIMRHRDIQLENTIELRAMMWDIAPPKPDLEKNTKWEHFEKGTETGNHKRQTLLRNHNGSLNAATPRRFTMSSCTRH